MVLYAYIININIYCHMPNAIKYTTGSETLALKKGNFYIGTGDVGKGPTDTTGYYNGITPPSGGFTIYLNKASGGPSIYTVTTEAQLTGLTSSIAGQTLTTSGACLNWFATQTDKMIFNIDYPAIVTNGLMLNVDAAFAPSYPTTGTTFYDTSSSGKNGTLANGPTYTSANGGGIVLDGTDDTYSITGISMGTSAFTLDCWFKYQTHSLYLPAICFAGDYWSGDNQTGWGFGQNAGASNYNFQMGELGAKLSVSLGSMVDGTIYNFVGTRTISGSQQILRGYVNGVLVGSATGNTIFNLSTSTYFPGYNPTILTPKQYSYTGPPPATLYNIKVYTRDLSASEITQNYAAMGSRYFSLEVKYLVVAGGGGGENNRSGGGGAGGLLSGTTTSLSLNTNYTVTVGSGGAYNAQGSNSVFHNNISIGGGKSGTLHSDGFSGGSGGGSGHFWSGSAPAPRIGGAGVSGQGFSGGTAFSGSSELGPGGGGASQSGGNSNSTPFGFGGTGLYSSEYASLGGSPAGWFAGGGGGGNSYGTTKALGGNGGGGNGSIFRDIPSTNGVINTGGGGGGSGVWGGGSASGGSGIVIIRVPVYYSATFSSGVTFSLTKSGGYSYYVVTATSTTSETVRFS